MRDVCVYIYTAQLTDWLANHANAPGTSGASLSLSAIFREGFFYFGESRGTRASEGVIITGERENVIGERVLGRTRGGDGRR